jgi:hypothetical protein
MGLFNGIEFLEPHAEEFHHPSDDCFLCGEKLTGDVWIFWNGFGGEIWFHPSCAKRMGDCLCSDWEKFKKQYPQLV